jgi:hypothetical protein
MIFSFHRRERAKLAVARILGDGKRQRTRVFTELQSQSFFAGLEGRGAWGCFVVRVAMSHSAAPSEPDEAQGLALGFAS